MPCSALALALECSCCVRPPHPYSGLVFVAHPKSTVQALILALEHRYYGASQPLPDLSTSNLRFLSSRQALQDIALFHEHATALMELPASTKWVAFGGSYPGMLAAWSRSKFPHLFHAAVSSSAPVEAILNMRGYNDVTAASLADSLVGGSKACLAAVQSAFAVLGSKLETAAGRRELERDLNACGGPGMRTLEDAGARALLAEGAADPLIPQSNDPACTSSPVCDIRGQCRMLTNDSIGLPYERLVELNRVARGGACLDANFTAMVEALRSVEVSDDRTDRVWFYQTCTEFAFYQTCDPDSACPFTSQPHINTLESYTGLCKQVFDIDAAAVASFVKETNAVYGGRSIRASRVLWVNGIIDPWRAQAVTKSPDPKLQPVLLVPGASHHFWTHPPQPTDSLYVVKARLQIADFVSKALAEPVADLFKGERAVARGSERAGQKHYTSDPTDWMLDNKRLPGVPLSPFQAVG